MGVWSYPKTIEAARSLENLFANPIEAAQASSLLYHLTGDDLLLDAILEAEEVDGPDADVRSIVAGKLEEWVQNADQFPLGFDDNVLDVLSGIVENDKLRVENSIVSSPRM